MIEIFRDFTKSLNYSVSRNFINLLVSCCYIDNLVLTINADYLLCKTYFICSSPVIDGLVYIVICQLI